MHDYCKHEQQLVILLPFISISSSSSSTISNNISNITLSPIQLNSSVSKPHSEPSHCRQWHNNQCNQSLAHNYRPQISCQTPSVQAQTTSHIPGVQTSRTTFPGGEAIHQNSSYSGQQGNTTFRYSSSSTSMNFTPAAQLPPPAWSVQYAHQPALPLPSIPQVQAAPTFIAMPMPVPAHPQPQPQPPQHHETRSPSPSYMTLNAGNTPIVETIPTPEQVFNPVAANQAPQNTRLADRFKRELTEATYFSDIPGMPDREVRR
jgi:hypothetical protein